MEDSEDRVVAISIITGLDVRTAEPIPRGDEYEKRQATNHQSVHSMSTSQDGNSACEKKALSERQKDTGKIRQRHQSQTGGIFSEENLGIMGTLECEKDTMSDLEGEAVKHVQSEVTGVNVAPTETRNGKYQNEETKLFQGQEDTEEIEHILKERESVLTEDDDSEKKKSSYMQQLSVRQNAIGWWRKALCSLRSKKLKDLSLRNNEIKRPSDVNQEIGGLHKKRKLILKANETPEQVTVKEIPAADTQAEVTQEYGQNVGENIVADEIETKQLVFKYKKIKNDILATKSVKEKVFEDKTEIKKGGGKQEMDERKVRYILDSDCDEEIDQKKTSMTTSPPQGQTRSPHKDSADNEVKLQNNTIHNPMLEELKEHVLKMFNVQEPVIGIIKIQGKGQDIVSKRAKQKRDKYRKCKKIVLIRIRKARDRHKSLGLRKVKLTPIQEETVNIEPSCHDKQTTSMEKKNSWLRRTEHKTFNKPDRLVRQMEKQVPQARRVRTEHRTFSVEKVDLDPNDVHIKRIDKPQEDEHETIHMYPTGCKRPYLVEQNTGAMEQETVILANRHFEEYPNINETRVETDYIEKPVQRYYSPDSLVTEYQVNINDAVRAGHEEGKPASDTDDHLNDDVFYRCIESVDIYTNLQYVDCQNGHSEIDVVHLPQHMAAAERHTEESSDNARNVNKFIQILTSGLSLLVVFLILYLYMELTTRSTQVTEWEPERGVFWETVDGLIQFIIKNVKVFTSLDLSYLFFTRTGD